MRRAAAVGVLARPAVAFLHDLGHELVGDSASVRPAEELVDVDADNDRGPAAGEPAAPRLPLRAPANGSARAKRGPPLQSRRSVHAGAGPAMKSSAATRAALGGHDLRRPQVSGDSASASEESGADLLLPRPSPTVSTESGQAQTADTRRLDKRR